MTVVHLLDRPVTECRLCWPHYWDGCPECGYDGREERADLSLVATDLSVAEAEQYRRDADAESRRPERERGI